MTRRSRKPKSPEQIAAEKAARQRAERMAGFAAVQLDPEAVDLPAYQDVEIVRAGEAREKGGDKDKAAKVVQSDTARRLDVFEALRPGMKGSHFAGAYDAARRLQHDITIRRGYTDEGRALYRVDTTDDGEGPGRIDAIIAAAKRVSAVLNLLPERDAWLLTWLMEPPPQFDHWRKVVAYITGETHTHAQGAAVRASCVHLRDAYVIIDKPQSRKAA